MYLALLFETDRSAECTVVSKSASSSLGARTPVLSWSTAEILVTAPEIGSPFKIGRNRRNNLWCGAGRVCQRRDT